MIEVAGFGKIQDAFVVVRQTEQSYTCCEKRARLTVENDTCSTIAFVKLDGGLFPTGDVCDYSISSMRNEPTGFLLELKGRDMLHAVEQLGKSLKKLTIRYAKAVVVSSGAKKIPSGQWQKVQKAFFSSHRVSLGRFTNNARVPFLAVVA